MRTSLYFFPHFALSPSPSAFGSEKYEKQSHTFFRYLTDRATS